MSSLNAASEPISPTPFPDAAPTIAAPGRILRLPEVMSRVGLRRASIYQHIALGSFPKQVALGVRAVGWLERQIDEWLSARIGSRGNPRTLAHLFSTPKVDAENHPVLAGVIHPEKVVVR
jgi:prophage regulatory protein